MSTTDEKLREAGAAWRAHVDAPAPATHTAPTRPARVAAPGPHELRRRRAVRRHRLVALAVLGAAAAVFVAFVMLAAPSFQGLGGAGADCAAPALSVRGATAPVVVHPGQTVAVTGVFYLTDCYDSGSHQGNPPAYGKVTVSLTGVARDVRLATVHPDHDGAFTAIVRIPAHFPAGRATLRSDVAVAKSLELTVAPSTTPEPGPQASSSTNR